jgi:hypothetical protein
VARVASAPGERATERHVRLRLEAASAEREWCNQETPRTLVVLQGAQRCMSWLGTATARRNDDRVKREMWFQRPRVTARAGAVACLACSTLVCAPPAGAAEAIAARSVTLSETGHLRLTSHHGFTLNEKGSAAGTIDGTIYIHLHIVSTNRVTAEVNIYPSGGSITGYATASYRPAGALASFNGTMSIARGTGRYARAHGAGLSFTGTVQRSNDAVTVRVSGRMST